MNKKLVFELHVGKRYGISRLNCDDSGQTKDVIIDNKKLNRISSQAKKHFFMSDMLPQKKMHEAPERHKKQAFHQNSRKIFS